MRDFDEAHACLDEASRQEALAAELIRGSATDAVEFARRRGFLREVHHGGHLALHPKSEFITFNHSLYRRIVLVAIERLAVERLHEIEHGALRSRLEW